MFLLGITGGVSSGKSLVANILKDIGVYVISADDIVHRLLNDPYILSRIREIFGNEVFEGEVLNRRKLAEIIFSDEKEREKLNHLIHPPVLSIMKEEIEKNKDIPIIACEVPLLFEVGIEDWFDEIWVVYAPIEKQIERTIKKFNISYESALKRVNSQIPIDEKVKRADYVIDNSGSIEDTKRQVMNRFCYIKRIVYNSKNR
jgi:dephospho-CoA kinase